jgi:hypothetical protein
MADIKKEFKEDVMFLEHLMKQYKDELKRTMAQSPKYRATRKNQLVRLRILMNEKMKHIEKTYQTSYFEEV